VHTLTLAPAHIAKGTVQLPGSKSLSIRALLLASLADGTTRLTNVLDSDDTQVMRGALRALGLIVKEVAPNSFDVTGQVPFPAAQADIFVGNSGLSIRTLAAALARMPGHYRLHGVPRMHERPIGDLVDAIGALGATVRYEGTSGFPPLLIDGTATAAVAPIQVKGNASSQFLTGLLQVAPLACATQSVQIEVIGDLISKPYVDMTIALMRQFGVSVERDGYQRFVLPQDSRYVSPGNCAVEGDASSASYFLAAGVLGGGPVRVQGAGRDSLQGDVQFAAFLAQVGAKVTWGTDWIEAAGDGRIDAFDLDFNHIPDAAMTAAVMALFARGPCRLRNIGSWRVKETDRLAAMAAELAKCGAAIESGADWLLITPPAVIQAAQIATYDDHRMAMSFSLLRFAGVPVVIEDPACVNKTFPRFFDAMKDIVQ
jgi:3-phosphoshikimate 1-carboxyvinyltransferase